MPFMVEVFPDVALLVVCDVLLIQQYLWKWHDVYDFRPHSVIIYLGSKLYSIPEVAPPTTISLIFANQCNMVISQIGIFFLYDSLSK